MEYGSYEKEDVTVPTADVIVREFVLLDSRGDPMEEVLEDDLLEEGDLQTA